MTTWISDTGSTNLRVQEGGRELGWDVDGRVVVVDASSFQEEDADVRILGQPGCERCARSLR